MNLYTQLLLQLIYVGLGTACFAVLLNVDKKDLIYAALISSTAFAASNYTLITFGNEYLSMMVAALLVSSLSLYLSKSKKKPLPVYLGSGLIPLLPGKPIFLSILSAVSRDMDQFTYNLEMTIVSLLVISISIIITTSTSKVVDNIVSNKAADHKLLHFDTD